MTDNSNINLQELIFGLDIGTRTVVGVVGYQEDNKFVVIASTKKDHESRAMIDGQIHDISKVSKTVEAVKNTLEQQSGLILKQVAIAAAGRVLRTQNVHIDLDFDDEVVIEKDHVRSLEYQGVQKSHENLQIEMEDSSSEYFCVGYSVVNYYLNRYMIANLEGHKGKQIGLDLLATFLPQIVVDSLYTVVDRVGLEVMSLTLEPIAAMNAAIPENLRLLNLALVDIGAGTSDIAITKEGSVVAYGMIPVAGDEITEQIVHNYLVDFHVAEKIKLQLHKKKVITFKDILGTSHKIDPQEILHSLESVIERLATEISDKIYMINGSKPPNAVFCVGGGGQIHGFTEKLANKLNLPPTRVALRGSETINTIVYKSKRMKGPDTITPIGICMTAILYSGDNFLNVTVNDDPIKLFNNNKLTVMDAAVQKGFDHTNLIGRKGQNLEFILNGKKKKIMGNPGESAELRVNGKLVSLEQPLHQGDHIYIKPAHHGESAKAIMKDFITSTNKKVTVNDKAIEFNVVCYINGNSANETTEIKTNDIVEIIEICTLQDLSVYAGLDLKNKAITINDHSADTNALIHSGDHILIKEINMNKPKEKTPSPSSIEIVKQNTDSSILTNQISLTVNGKSILLNGDKKQYMFVDIFNYIDFDLSRPKGNIVLELNGQKAGFTDLIKPGDQIQIYWD